jgi:hypothetical protein
LLFTLENIRCMEYRIRLLLHMKGEVHNKKSCVQYDFVSQKCNILYPSLPYYYYYYVTFQNGYLNGSSIFKTIEPNNKNRVRINAVRLKSSATKHINLRGIFQCNFSPGCIACNTDNLVITKKT